LPAQAEGRKCIDPDDHSGCSVENHLSLAVGASAIEKVNEDRHRWRVRILQRDPNAAPSRFFLFCAIQNLLQVNRRRSFRLPVMAMRSMLRSFRRLWSLVQWGARGEVKQVRRPAICQNCTCKDDDGQGKGDPEPNKVMTIPVARSSFQAEKRNHS